MILTALSAALLAVSPTQTEVSADSLYSAALEAESSLMYLTADSLYRSGYEASVDAGERQLAELCRTGSYRMQRILLEFPFTREEADSILQEKCPWLSSSERDRYFNSGMMDHLDFQGGTYYFSDCVANLLYRNLDLMHEWGRRHRLADPFYEVLQDQFMRPRGSGYPQVPWIPDTDPRTFLVEGSMSIPRDQLPDSGLLRIWVPVPIQSAAQTDPRVVGISPSDCVVYPPATGCELGTAYMEVILDSLETDLEVSVSTLHTHYRRECLVDPERVGEYDREDPEYVLYTTYGQNTVCTPDMEDLAWEIVGDETNPWFQARMIYDYIVENIPYSFVPHMSLQVLGIPESVFCHENGHGDCGTQSMYFSALCRSLGIPARACGGMQLVPGVEGSHFWAEFMLPGYGWIPVDVTVAETADWSWQLSDEERRVFKDFFFAALDPYRMVIQKDVSVPLHPDPREPVAMAVAIQFPAMVCTGSIQDPSIIAAMNWSVEVTPIDR